MAEHTPDLRDLDRDAAYDELATNVAHVLDGVDDVQTGMATIAALVHHGFGHLWTGFYRVVEPGQLLRVGPYQGTLGCLEIAFGRGGAAHAARPSSSPTSRPSPATSRATAAPAPRSSSPSSAATASSSPSSTSTPIASPPSTTATAAASSACSAGFAGTGSGVLSS